MDIATANKTTLPFDFFFFPKILSGEKTQTIRRRAPFGPGNKLVCVAKSGAQIVTVICKDVTNIDIWPGRIALRYLDSTQVISKTEPEDLLRFIQADGFEKPEEFFDFFKARYELPFSGYLIEWHPPKEAV